MTDPQQELAERFGRAIVAAFGAEHAGTDPLVRPAQNTKFGDYQSNVAMGLGKRLGRNPREIAAAVVEKLEWRGLLAEPPGVAGPGFINLKLGLDYISQFASSLCGDERLGVTPAAAPQIIVVDYSSPNVAKEMHVGHLRSTVIGDALARTLDFTGHTVIRQNHLGDWGTQFGMLIEHLNEVAHAQASTDSHISDLNSFYQESKKRFDAEPEFAERARQRVVALQSGDAATLAQWRKLVDESKQHFNEAYARLGITLDDSHIRGESFYNALLPGVVQALRDTGLAQLSEGAWCVFVAGHEHPLMVQKTGGGFGYAATDLAAIRYRVEELHADRIIYVVDARQSDHFAQVFHVARAAGWLGESHTAEHVKFGTILGEDGRPFKTRTGETVKLKDLLDEAEQRAMAIVKEKTPDHADVAGVARMVGIGAVKYGDLSADRIKDYVFSWDRMLAMDGNTAPYLQYAYARIRSIFRKSDTTDEPGSRILVAHEAERALVLKLAQFPQVVRGVAERLEPHHLCTWLYEVAAAFSGFYESCPVLRAETEVQCRSRLALCDLTARALKRGLDLLGIEVIERM